VAFGLAGRVREARLARTWTQGDLADRAGVSGDTIKRFERTGRITLDNLLRIALALGQLDAFAAVIPAAGDGAETLADLEARSALAERGSSKRVRGRRRDAGKRRS
jgi:HTH-type transcriptional regulator/antitoxin HipB